MDNRQPERPWNAVRTASYMGSENWSTVDLSPGARVARGMLYVQRTYPEALSIVDIDHLDIASGSDCVLGQIHGDYMTAPEVQINPAFRRAHGFTGTDSLNLGIYFNDCDTLTALWQHAFRVWRDAS